MAAIRVGLISFSCSKCQEAPYIKDTLGCEKPLEVAAKWLGEEDEFYNCPVMFIMSNTYELLEKMDNYKNGLSTPPDYEMQSAKFLCGVRLLDSYIAKFTSIKKGE